jgi:MFS family permease
LACTTGLESGERQSLSQAVDGIQHQFHVSDSAVGFLPLAMAIVAIFGSVPIGILTDRTRRTTLLAGAMAIWTGCMALNGIAASFAALFLFRMGVGAVEANGPAAVSLIADYYPVEERAKRNGLYQSGALAGAMIGFVGGGLAVSWGGWHWAFLMWIPLGIAVTMLVAIQPEPRRGDQDADFETDVSNPLDVSNVRVRLPQPRRVGDLTYETARARDVYAELAKTPSFWFGTMAITISQLLLNALAFWGVPYFKRVHHMGAVAAGGVAALLGAGSAIGIIGGGFLADHYLARGVLNARVYVIAWGSIAATAVLLPAFWSTSLAVTAPLLFVGGLLLTIPVAPADAIVTDVVVPDLRGRALAIRSIVRTASTAGALLVGGLSAAFLANGWSRADSLRFAIVAITPLYAAGGLIMFLAARWYPHDVAFVAAESRRRGIAVED